VHLIARLFACANFYPAFKHNYPPWCIEVTDIYLMLESQNNGNTQVIWNEQKRSALKYEEKQTVEGNFSFPPK
jgi:hypothetical protein